MTQLKADLDATLAEKGELQKEIFDKVAAHEKQLLLQKEIDNLNSTLDEVKAEKETVKTQLELQVEEKNQAIE